MKWKSNSQTTHFLRGVKVTKEAVFNFERPGKFCETQLGHR